MRNYFKKLSILAGLVAGFQAGAAADVPVPAADQWSKPVIELVLPGIWRLRFGTPERFTPHAVRETPPRVEGLNSLPAPGPLPLMLEQIRCRITPSRTTIFLPFDEPEQEIYGFGLDPGAYQQKGLRKNLTVCSTVIGKTGASHAPVPFYLSTKGYGVYVDTARVPSVEVARLAPVHTAGTNDSDTNRLATSELELYSARVTHGKKEILFDLPGDAVGVDVYVFGGPTMREAVQRYNLFSGGGAVPPLWGLGMKFRSYTKADQALVLKTARALRELNIPCDMFGLEPGWQSHAYSCSFTWSKERFPDPDKMIHELQSSGFKINLWEHAFVHPTSPLFAPLKTYSADFLVWNGLAVDFADPKASKIFSDFHDRELVARGILGFKGDECDKEPPSDETPFNFQYSSVFPSGIDGDQMTQLYGYYYQRALLAPFKARNLRTWGDIRASTALAAPLPFNLYSDAYSFDQYLRQLVNASFTGLLWSPEVRQAGNLDELLNRVAMSALAPQMCLDMWFMPNPVWEQFNRSKNVANQLLPADEQRDVANRLRAIVNQRYALLPYLYSSFQKYHEAGLPPVRSLVLDFPDDQQLRSVDDAFMFGEALLAAPYLGTNATRKVILPRGVNWYELNQKKWHRGGDTVTVTGVPGEMPLFIKENSLLPLAEPVQQIDSNTVFQVTVTAFGAHPTPLTLFDDDGITYDFEAGAISRLALSWTPEQGGNATRTGAFPPRRHNIVRWESVRGPE
jgi:alpha-D-xyloside xylohydrolase